MSVFIKGMDMPYSCKWCNMFNLINDINVFRCGANNEYYEADFDYHNKRHPDCPLVEIPTPHGRLIDANEIKEYAEWHCQRFINGDHAEVGLTVDQINSFVRNAPTIIEAEVGE